MPQYIRSKTPGGLYFFTVVTFGRHQFLTSPLARGILRQTWRDVPKKHPFDEADFERHFKYHSFQPGETRPCFPPARLALDEFSSLPVFGLLRGGLGMH